MSQMADIADAVVEALNAGQFSQQFTAQRKYRALIELKDLKTLHVTVVPKAADSERFDRGRFACEYAVDVAVQKKLESTADSQVDALIGLVEEIRRSFAAAPRLAGVDAILVKTANEPIYDADHLDQLRQFTGVLTLTFRALE